MMYRWLAVHCYGICAVALYCATLIFVTLLPQHEEGGEAIKHDRTVLDPDNMLASRGYFLREDSILLRPSGRLTPEERGV